QKELRAANIPAEIIVCGQETKQGPFWCFRDHTPADLTLNGTKIVGSAQRKNRGALLQHGTLRTQTSPIHPDLPGIASPAITTAWLRNLATHFGTVVPTTWTTADEARIQELSPRYADPAWNAKR
ncbi:MAG: lipoate--protein ligase family protein, partial [Gemmataceae bacterium]